MAPETVLLRFQDRQQASAVLGRLGAEFCAVAGNGILYRATGETVQFEGECIALTCPASGYHVQLRWLGPLPDVLAPHLVSQPEQVSQRAYGE